MPQVRDSLQQMERAGENVASGNLSKYSSIANATSSEFNWTILIIIAIAVAGVLYFVAQNAQQAMKDI